MLRVIFDTNIYGLLVTEKNIDIIERKIEEDKEFVVYGFKLIRKELRSIPKEAKLGRLSQRNLILSLYDRITGSHYLQDSLVLDKLALQYYNAYRNFGGLHRWQEIKIDFTIVACAAHYNLDIVYSDDKRTMLNKDALKAYKHINIKNNLRTPWFYSYKDILLKFGIR